MKIALIGATGFVGSPVLVELLSRGHQVTVLARNPAKLPAQPNLTVVAADALDAAQVAQAVAGHDAVVSAYNPGWTEPRIYEVFLQGSAAIVEGVKNFEIRNNDRQFKVGDIVVLDEFDPNEQKFTGRGTSRVVTYITDFEQKPGYVVMALKDTLK